MNWLRYNWWKALLHLAILGFGVVNLYPFFWMVGTSLKAEAEASEDRLTPVPHRKYKLAEGFDLSNVVPSALEADLAGARGKARDDLLHRLRKRLELIHRLQQDAWAKHVKDHIKRIDPSADAAGLLAALVAKGVLVHDATTNSYWLSQEAFGRKFPAGLAASELAAARKLWDYLTLTPSHYAELTGESGDATKAIRQWEASAGAPLTYVADGDDGTPAWRLSTSMRGRIYKDLFPRQILTLWSMDAENVRRSESRQTFAHDRWSPADYQKKHGLADMGAADAELVQMREAGYLANGSVQLINYWVVLKEENFLLHFLTSMVVTAVVVAGVVLMSSMLGYALARMRFPGKFLVLGVMIAASILPGEARTVPIFRMLMSIGALDSLWGMVAWMMAGGVGNALLMAGFFLTLPKEVDEAAEVDGAGVFRRFFDIALPMARPIVTTVGLFAFLASWNDFLVPLLCTISRPSMQPLAVAVYNFQQGHPGKWHEINAAAALMIVPVIIMFLMVQRHVVKAIAVGAVKG
jgi:raffinose/stachyose/melibiose transport system permease protein